MLKPDERLALLNIIFVFIHLVYFIIYASKYTSGYQQIRKLKRIRRAKLMSECYLNEKIASLTHKVTNWKRKSYWPILFIGFLHFAAMYFYYPTEINHQTYVAGITAGAASLIFLTNWIKGAQIVDPNRRFSPFNFRR